MFTNYYLYLYIFIIEKLDQTDPFGKLGKKAEGIKKNPKKTVSTAICGALLKPG